MPNEKNVAALFGALRGTLSPNIPDVSVNDIAFQIAARGVLVPSALTVEQMTGDLWRYDTEDGTADLIAALERIAKGES